MFLGHFYSQLDLLHGDEIEGHTFDLRRGDESSLVYFACTSPLWLLVPSTRALGTVGRTPDPDLFFPPSYNKHLALPIASIVSSVPIKRGVVEEIGTTIHVGKGKEKLIKKVTVKKSEAEEGVVGIAASQGTKKRKTGSACKKLVVFEDPREVYPAAEKEVSHPLIPKIRVKTKVEVSPLVTGGTLQEKVVAYQPPVISSVEKGVSSGDVAGETEQVPEVVKDVESTQAPVPSVV
ncbi:hypothetical protein SO802_015044 [Lithocarpus litseifolius]|uniref:Uncharacterized protein n=1 Tax=Lithocarpus litseifolius TaxID=425828 RepID=A0AAW2CSN1_9ROSI